MSQLKFNKEITKKILELRKEGASIQMCADMVGIDESTIRSWVKKGEKAKTGPYKEFYLDMKQAKGEYGMYHLRKMNKIKEWKGHRYALARAYPDDFPADGDRIVVKEGNHKSLLQEFLEAQKEYNENKNRR